MKISERGVQKKFTVVANALIHAGEISIKQPLVAVRRNGQIVTLRAPLFTADTLDELRSDLHLEIDRLFDYAALMEI